ncbi:MAG: phosphotransferase, partial [Chloroflexi bacterium]|nr:phosphotransferase [Chloroflexota bacterium]
MSNATRENSGTDFTGAQNEQGEPWDRLAEFLGREAFAGSKDLRITNTARPTGGASWETFLVNVEFERGGDTEAQRVAIKRAPPSGPLAPYLVNKDVAIFSTLAASDVPVPQLLAWTEDASVFVRPFTVTSFIEGESHDITKIERWPVWQREREALGRQMIDKLAALQRFSWQGTSLEAVLGQPGSADKRVTAVVDLTSEFPEPAGVRRNRVYLCSPILDRSVPEQRGAEDSPADALARIVQTRPTVRLAPCQRAFVERHWGRAVAAGQLAG